jgi:hypothetical protein
MPAPPILEVYVVWHPDDELGAWACDQLTQHFHGSAYSGLAGGAVEVYPRCAGWVKPSGPPRPLPFMESLPADLPSGQLTVVVPILGRGMAKACRRDAGWQRYIEAIFEADLGTTASNRARIAAYPLLDPSAELSGSQLLSIGTRRQILPQQAATSPTALAREVAQAIAQRIARDSPELDLDERITIFVSHTKRRGSASDDCLDVVSTVRDVLGSTHMDAFFDARDIQVADDWTTILDTEAERHALLMVRTDSYASREWTQREVLAAKTHDIPIVSLYAVREEEQRGSFLMDHVPVVACLPGKTREGVERALNRLVDEALKRALWLMQRVYLERNGFDWLPVHAPEPVTLASWLEQNSDARRDPRLMIMHPDPPLGPRERDVIVRIGQLAGLPGSLDLLTPRTFAMRGGQLAP